MDKNNGRLIWTTIGVIGKVKRQKDIEDNDLVLGRAAGGGTVELNTTCVAGCGRRVVRTREKVLEKGQRKETRRRL